MRNGSIATGCDIHACWFNHNFLLSPSFPLFWSRFGQPVKDSADHGIQRSLLTTKHLGKTGSRNPNEFNCSSNANNGCRRVARSDSESNGSDSVSTVKASLHNYEGHPSKLELREMRFVVIAVRFPGIAFRKSRTGPCVRPTGGIYLSLLETNAWHWTLYAIARIEA